MASLLVLLWLPTRQTKCTSMALLFLAPNTLTSGPAWRSAWQFSLLSETDSLLPGTLQTWCCLPRVAAKAFQGAALLVLCRGGMRVLWVVMTCFLRLSELGFGRLALILRGAWTFGSTSSWTAFFFFKIWAYIVCSMYIFLLGLWELVHRTNPYFELSLSYHIKR